MMYFSRFFIVLLFLSGFVHSSTNDTDDHRPAAAASGAGEHDLRVHIPSTSRTPYRRFIRWGTPSRLDWSTRPIDLPSILERERTVAERLLHVARGRFIRFGCGPETFCCEKVRRNIPRSIPPGRTVTDIKEMIYGYTNGNIWKAEVINFITSKIRQGKVQPLLDDLKRDVFIVEGPDSGPLPPHIEGSFRANPSIESLQSMVAQWRAEDAPKALDALPYAATSSAAAAGDTEGSYVTFDASVKITTQGSVRIDWNEKPRDENDVWQRILFIAHHEFIKTPGTFERLIPEWKAGNVPLVFPTGWSVRSLHHKIIIESFSPAKGAELLTIIEPKVWAGDVLPAVDSGGHIVMIFGSERWPLKTFYESESAFLQASPSLDTRAARAAEAERREVDERAMATAETDAAAASGAEPEPSPHAEERLPLPHELPEGHLRRLALAMMHGSAD